MAQLTTAKMADEPQGIDFATLGMFIIGTGSLYFSPARCYLCWGGIRAAERVSLRPAQATRGSGPLDCWAR